MMFNPYSIILGLFSLAGFIMMLWSWRAIRKGRETRHWARVEGIIEQTTNANDLMPEISFGYTVAGQTFHQTLEVTEETPPIQDLKTNKYRPGNTIDVYYDPVQPDRIVLEAGPKGGDWLVFIIGMGTLVFGIILLL